MISEPLSSNLRLQKGILTTHLAKTFSGQIRPKPLSSGSGFSARTTSRQTCVTKAFKTFRVTL